MNTNTSIPTFDPVFYLLFESQDNANKMIAICNQVEKKAQNLTPAAASKFFGVAPFLRHFANMGSQFYCAAGH